MLPPITFKRCGDHLGLLQLLVCLFVLTGIVGSLQTIDRATFCTSSPVVLNCLNKSSLLAIHSAVLSSEGQFADNVTTVACSSAYQDAADPDGDVIVREIEFCSDDIRASLNNRCAGRNQCTYNYSHDHIDKKCSSEGGALLIDYACVEESSILKYCNYPAVSREGYISTPGYPSFFPRLQNCTWNLTAGQGQTIAFNVVDLYIRPARLHQGREVCDEALTIFDGSSGDSTRLTTACGQAPLGSYESSTSEAVIQFNSQKFTPFRGFLIYYRFQGCPTLSAPKQGHMVERNDSWAIYTCCSGHVFNDTLDNVRIIHCVDGFSWNATVPDCMSFAEIRETGNFSIIDLVWNVSEVTSGSKTYWAENNMMADVIVPSALMASLVIGNAVVLIIILKIRRKSKYSEEYVDCDDELQPKPCSSSEPNHTEV